MTSRWCERWQVMCCDWFVRVKSCVLRECDFLVREMQWRLKEIERAMARESFTLLNLTDSESESVPDLDLVLPAARKQIKRKVGRKMKKLPVTISTVRYYQYLQNICVNDKWNHELWITLCDTGTLYRTENLSLGTYGRYLIPDFKDS